MTKTSHLLELTITLPAPCRRALGIGVIVLMTYKKPLERSLKNLRSEIDADQGSYRISIEN